MHNHNIEKKFPEHNISTQQKSHAKRETNQWEHHKQFSMAKPLRSAMVLSPHKGPPYLAWPQREKVKRMIVT